MFIELENIQNGQLAARIAHHAILLTSRWLATENEDGGLPFAWFAAFAKQFCGISLVTKTEEGKAAHGDEDLWQLASTHSDVFIADRQRSLLRLEEVAPLTQLANYPPLIAKRRLFFIDRAARLNVHATNSLLKLLEEPQIPCLFLLTAHRTADVLPTLVSRCFRLQAKIPRAPTAGEATGGLEAEDWQQMSQHVLNLVTKPMPAPLGDTMWASATPTSRSKMAHQTQDIVSLADRLAKQYEAEVLQAALTQCLAVTWQRVATNPLARAQMRFILSDLKQWRRAMPYHPSAAHWVARILLKGVV